MGLRRKRVWLASVCALIALGALGIGLLLRSSLTKTELAQKLAAIEKNRAFGALERREFSADLGSGLESFELVSFAASGSNSPAHVPVLLIHGTPSTLYTWSALIHGDAEFEGLAATRDVYALEVIGHGIGPASSAPLTFERCARYVNAAVRELGLERVHIVGSSYGGEFVWRAVLNEPALYASMVLIDSSGFERREQDWLPEEIEMRENPLAKIGWLINAPDRIETALTPHFDVIPAGSTEEFFLVCENRSNWEGMVDLARDENGEREGELKRIETPTLVLWGENDVAYDLEVYGKRFAAEIPGAKLHVLPNTGHYPHEQRPAETLQALESFFADVEAER